MALRTFALPALFLLFTAAACGDDGTPPATDAAADTGGDTDGGGTDGGGGTDSATPTDGGGGTDSATPTDGGGGTDSATDGGGGTDSATATDGGSPGVDCMGTTCNATTEQCCITRMGMMASGACIAAGATCEGGATIDCDGPEDCSGASLCCASVSLMGVSVECRTAADGCGGPGTFTEFELCHSTADCTDTTGMCCPFDRLGFSGSVCRATCGGIGIP